MTSIVIATIKSWNIAFAKELARKYKDVYNITIITSKEKLTVQRLRKIKPKYIFFPHWSWIIPSSIFSECTCVVFHMTDLPFGRGGSPMQNLISRGIYKTKISALKVDGGLDTGPIYLKKPFSLKSGSAQQLFQQIAQIVFKEMIPYILEKNPAPKPQLGEATSFPRRKPVDSNLLATDFSSTAQLYDFIRMLDGEGYPPAFIKLPGGYTLRLNNAQIGKKEVRGTFAITKDEQ